MNKIINKEYKPQSPLISIIIACLNSGLVLENTILNIIKQTYKNKEIVIIDGSSTDNTLELIKKYKSNLNYFISEKDQGVYFAMNKGILAAKGEILHFLNAGDFYFNENVLEIVAEKFRTDRDLSILYGLTECFSTDKSINYISGSGKIRNIYLNGMPTSHQAIFFKKEVFKLIGLYNTDYKIVADFEFFLRFKKNYSKYNFKEGYIDVPLAKYNLSGFSDRNHKATINELKRVSIAYYGDRFFIRLYFFTKELKHILLNLFKLLGLHKFYRRVKYNFFYKIIKKTKQILF